MKDSVVKYFLKLIGVVMAAIIVMFIFLVIILANVPASSQPACLTLLGISFTIIIVTYAIMKGKKQQKEFATVEKEHKEGLISEEKYKESMNKKIKIQHVAYISVALLVVIRIIRLFLN